MIIFFLYLSYSNLYSQTNHYINGKNSKNNFIESRFIPKGPFGGSIIDMVSYIKDKNIIFAISQQSASSYSNIYKTIDGGENWFLLTDLYNYFYCIAIDHNNSEKIYIGSGSEIYISTNGGTTWVTKDINTTDYFCTCYGIEVSEKNPNIIYLYTLANKRDAESKNICIHKSIDGGKHWTHTLLSHDINPKYISKHLFTLDKSNDQKIFFAHDRSVFISTDGGIIWNEIDLSSFFSNDNYICCLDSDTESNVIVCIKGRGVFISKNPYESWIISSEKPDDLNSIKYLKTDSDIVAGGTGNTFYISSDAGRNWISSKNGLEGNTLNKILLTSSTDFYVCSNKGTFKSVDQGRTWRKIVKGFISEYKIENLLLFKDSPNILFTSVGDRFGHYSNNAIYKSINSGASWSLIKSFGNVSSSVFSMAINENSSETLYISGYVFAQERYFYKTTNGGLDWISIKSYAPSQIVTSGNSIWAFYYSQSTDFIIIKSTDGGINWKNTSPIPTGTTFLEVHPYNDNILYIGGNSFIYKSTDSGNSWINTYESTSSNPVSSIRIDPSNPDNAYFGAGNGLFKSTDGGNTWNEINLSMDYGACKSLYIDKNGIIYAGFFMHIGISVDGGSTWQKYYDGLNAKINENCLTVDEINNILYVGTKDKGIFSLNLNTSTGINEDVYHTNDSYTLCHNYPNPFNQETAISYLLSSFCNVKLEIYNTLGQHVNTLVHENKPPGEYKIIWDGRDKSGKGVTSGVYFYRLKAGDFSEVKKMILLR